MPVSDDLSPEAPRTRAPYCTIASWAVPALGGLITFMVYQKAVEQRGNGDWLPGMGQFIIGAIITATATFGCGLAALLRREQNRWLALLPFLTALGILLYFGWNYLRNRLGG